MGNSLEKGGEKSKIQKFSPEFPRSPEEIKVRVSVAIIEKDGKFLIGKRPADKPYGEKWEFPGGKLNPGETFEQALKREVEEETGVFVVNAIPCLEWDYKFSDGNFFHLVAFRCVISGDPEPKVDSELRWVLPEELGNYDFLGGDSALIDTIKSWSSQKK